MGVSFSSSRVVLTGRACWSGWCSWSGWWCWSVMRGGRGRRVSAVAALGPDQVREPPHLALDGLDAVALELGGVAVELGLHAGEPLLQPRAATLEDVEPDLHVGGGEEREPDVEVVVLPCGGADLGHQSLEVLVAGRRDLVGDPRAPGRRRGGSRDLGDQVGAEHLLQRGVERAVGQHPTPSEHQVEPLAQLVAVHGSLVQQPEDCELDGVTTVCHVTYRTDISGYDESGIADPSPYSLAGEC